MKRKVILGMFIIMAMAVCGIFWSQSTPQVFAEEITAQTDEIDISDAGTFIGQGYYEVGQTVTLTAVINPGYKFNAWISVDANGVETELSTDLVCTIAIKGNMTIKPVVERLEYDVTFAEDLWDKQDSSKLEDFTYEIVNKTRTNGKNYYGDKIEIKIDVKSGKYMDDMNIIPTSTSDIDDMNFDMNIINAGIVGFTNAIVTFDIKDNVMIDMEYVYKYVLTIQSSNSDIDISELVQFITLSDTAKLLDSSAYKYLVRADQQVTITTYAGNSVYYFNSSQFQGQSPTKATSMSYTLIGDSVFKVEYLKHKYTIDFNSYLVNLYNQKDLIQNPFYNIDNVELTAGESVSFTYNETTRQIIITDAKNTETQYNYPTDRFGYRFVEFVIGGQSVGTSNTYTLSSTAPTHAEIQLIFKYVEYSLEIVLVDDYFADDITYSIVYGNEFNKLVDGTQVTLYAETSQYKINGWSDTDNPKENGYIDEADDNAKSDMYKYTFEPISDDNSQSYIIYLDVDYTYLSVEFNLKSSSIVQNVEYDVVSVDTINRTMVFSDSESSKTTTVTYIDENISIEDGVTTISTTEMGDIVIDGNTLTYAVNLIKNTSINKTTQDGVDVYTFKKYTYFGDLQLGVIDHITLDENGEQVTVNFNGNIYPEQLGFDGHLRTFTTTKVYNDKKGAYEITYYKQYADNSKTTVLTMYLYMNGAEYDYIVLRNVIYYYDSVNAKFVLKNAERNKPADIVANIVKSSTYSIKLDNLLPNSILVYFTQSTNVSNYNFINYTNAIGTSLWSFEDNGKNICILNSTTTTQLGADYRQLANSIALLINIENAYSYENITFSVERDGETSYGTGNVVSAKNDDIITIAIIADNIAMGYQFDGYTFEGNDRTDVNNKYVLTFPMDASIYANKIININFSAIQYTINVNYLDANSELVNQDDSVGYLSLQGRDKTSTILVNITEVYTFQAVSATGYYVANAYIGSDAYTLGGLIGSNADMSLVTYWSLNSINFEEAIIENVADGTELNLYIRFAKHTYSAKVYFEISSHATEIIYPILKINAVKHNPKAQIEDGSTKYFVEAKGFEHGNNVNFTLENFMIGTTIDRWCNLEGSTILEHSNTYIKIGVDGDVVLRVVLQYVSYNIEFVTIDENGDNCKYGSAQTLNGLKTFKLLDTVKYSVTISQGYVLKQSYYYNGNGEIKDVENVFDFNPADFKIENGTTFKIYLVFGLKAINLKVVNAIYGEKYYYSNLTENELATYTISRLNNGVMEPLDAIATNQFLTGDKLVMTLTPISIGVKLNKINLNKYVIEFGNAIAHSLTIVEVKDEGSGNITGVNYALTLEFTPEIINGLSDTEDNVLQNLLQVKTFNARYSYNYINYKFGIRLTREYQTADGATRESGNTDEEMLFTDIGFGTTTILGCSWEGINTGEGSKFIIEGYSIAGIKQLPNAENNRFAFNSIEFWEQVALLQYLNNSQTISMILELRPKITLVNYTEYSEEDGYIYNNDVYNSDFQGIEAGVDVVIGGDFEIIIKYLKGEIYLDGNGLPKDAGTYNVEIKAIISNEIPPILFEESVKYIIAKAPVTVSLKSITPQNQLTKIYGDADSLYLQIIADDIKFDGIYPSDKITVNKTNLQIRFMGQIVCDSCDIMVLGIGMSTENNKPTTNYILASGETVTFSRIGKIAPKALQIRGFTINNKVYDGTGDVYVNINNIVYDEPIGNDDVTINKSKLKFYLKDYGIGENKEVFIDWDYESVLIGADRYNYEITYDKSKCVINVHPYELSCDVSGYGTFKIVDRDKLAIIPIGSRMLASVFEKGSEEYRSIYGLIEGGMKQGEKLTGCFEVIMQLNSVNLQVPEGLYVYIPKTSKTTQVAQLYEEESYENLEYAKEGSYTVVKVVKGYALIGVVSSTTYLPLWAIILIVVGVFVVILILVTIFIIIRRKTKSKYSKYDRI